jgi:hypothetical protein
MGEHHPSEHKVIVEFSPDRLSLTDVERSKLIKLAGARFNPSLGTIKISCESFETAAQNKRYLGDLVETLIKEAKDPADTFADVPFDFRHHRPKPFHDFPDAWKVTPARRQELLGQLAAQRGAAGAAAVVDGRMFLPGGPEERRKEDVQAMQVRREAVLATGVWPGSGFRVTPKEREALEAQRAERLLGERMLVVADSKSRRSSKREIFSRSRMALRRAQTGVGVGVGGSGGVVEGLGSASAVPAAPAATARPALSTPR